MLAEDAEDMDRALNDRVVASLERVPDLSSAIPEDFAARVAAGLAAKRPVSVRSTSYGRAATWAGLAILMVALIAVSYSGVEGSSLAVVVEWTLVLQFLAIAVWLGVRRWRES
jgi:hypothetical protein